MRILTISNSGIFSTSTSSRLPSYEDWPKSGYVRCPTPSDRALFNYLEQADWGDGHICVAVRWSKVGEVLAKDQASDKESIVACGSGVQFYWMDNRILYEDETHFLCEIPWSKIHVQDSEEPRFRGGEALRVEFQVHLSQRAQDKEGKRERLQRQLQDVDRQLALFTRALHT